MIKRVITFLFLAAGLMFMVMIYSFSAQNSVDTNEVSGKLTEKIASMIFINYDTFTPEFKNGIVTELNLIIRKIAHFSLYFSLSFVMYMFFSLIKSRYLLSGFLSVAICMVYAIFDEFHQSLVPGRTSLVKDVFIDGFGALLGSVFCFMVIAALKLIADKIRRQGKE